MGPNGASAGGARRRVATAGGSGAVAGALAFCSAAALGAGASGGSASSCGASRLGRVSGATAPGERLDCGSGSCGGVVDRSAAGPRGCSGIAGASHCSAAAGAFSSAGAGRAGAGGSRAAGASGSRAAGASGSVGGMLGSGPSGAGADAGAWGVQSLVNMAPPRPASGSDDQALSSNSCEKRIVFESGAAPTSNGSEEAAGRPCGGSDAVAYMPNGSEATVESAVWSCMLRVPATPADGDDMDEGARCSMLCVPIDSSPGVLTRPTSGIEVDAQGRRSCTWRGSSLMRDSIDLVRTGSLRADHACRGFCGVMPLLSEPGEPTALSEASIASKSLNMIDGSHRSPESRRPGRRSSRRRVMSPVCSDGGAVGCPLRRGGLYGSLMFRRMVTVDWERRIGGASGDSGALGVAGAGGCGEKGAGSGVDEWPRGCAGCSVTEEELLVVRSLAEDAVRTFCRGRRVGSAAGLRRAGCTGSGCFRAAATFCAASRGMGGRVEPLFTRRPSPLGTRERRAALRAAGGSAAASAAAGGSGGTGGTGGGKPPPRSSRRREAGFA